MGDVGKENSRGRWLFPGSLPSIVSMSSLLAVRQREEGNSGNDFDSPTILLSAQPFSLQKDLIVEKQIFFSWQCFPLRLSGSSYLHKSLAKALSAGRGMGNFQEAIT
jgi:hypothetical protein